MKLLVIGNGFDFAYGLPTKYLDFLEFVKVIKQIIKKCNVADIEWGNVNIQVKELIMSNLGDVRNNLYSHNSYCAFLIWSEITKLNHFQIFLKGKEFEEI